MIKALSSGQVFMRWKSNFLLFILLGLAGLLPAAARDPLGVGLTESGFNVASDSWLGFFVQWQVTFDQMMRGYLRSLSDDPTSGAWLLGAAFLYGLAHAAGPGHGKFVISAYLLASRQTIVQGIRLSFLSSLAQGIAAIVLVFGLFSLLKLSVLQIKPLTNGLEIASFSAMFGLGLWLCWGRVRGVISYLRQRAGPRQEADHTHHQHSATCGCAHLPSAEMKPRSLWSQLGIIATVALRPCSGAILILALTLSQGQFVWGAGAALSMALGTALTVGVIAVFASTLSQKLGGGTAAKGQGWTQAIGLGLSLAAAAALAVFGFGFLFASLARSGWF